MVKGKVVDGNNQVVDGAKVVIEYKDGMNRKFEVKTNKKGEYLQIGLPPGNWTVTASKDGVGTATERREDLDRRHRAGRPHARGGRRRRRTLSKEDAAFQKVFSEGVAASQAGNHDVAIEKYSEALKTRPTCYSCQSNLGLSYAAKKDIGEGRRGVHRGDEAQGRRRRAVQPARQPVQREEGLREGRGDGRRSLEALERRRRAAAAPTRTSTRACVLMNAQKMAEAKTAFEAAVKAKPDYADAWYLLASAYTNQGQFKEAVEAYENYVKLAPPSDAKKIEGAKQNIAALKPLIK